MKEAGSLDETLVLRLRAMDDDAWGELYDAHRERLWRYVYARTGSRDLADEVVQQAFVEAVASVRRFNARGTPILAWLYTIARNHTAKALRRRPTLPVAGTPVPDDLDARLEALALRSALARLPRPQRDVLILRFVAGYSTEDIANALRKSPAAVYSLQARALRSSRQILEHEGFSGRSDEFGTRVGIDTAT